MIEGQYVLPLARELVVDLFAGGGGASCGIEQAIGRHVDIAVNHDRLAVAQHFANHPQTRHYCEDVFDVDPIAVTEGRPVGLLWASPDCKHFSKAKGGKPRSKKIRALADVIVRWAEELPEDQKPKVICMENVEEFKTWGELDDDGHPIRELAGLLFQRWKARIEAQGYVSEFRELRASDHNTPTIRKRLFGIFRRDGQPIVWPAPTNAKGARRGSGLRPWRTAAECIDFTLKAESIFDRRRPLVKNTCRRVAKGLWRHVLSSSDPFFVEANGAHLTPFLNEHANSSNQRTMRADEPLRTLMAQVKGGHFSLVSPTLAVLRGTSEAPLGAHHLKEPVTAISAGGTHHALAAAHLVTIGYGERKGQAARTQDIRTPTGTAVAGGVKQALAMAFMEQANGGFYDGEGRSLRDPVSTITQAGSNQQLVTAYCIKYYGSGGQWQGLDEPMHTIPTKGRMGLVQVRQVPLDMLPAEQRRRAKQCADLLHEHLPEHFPEPAEAVLVWQRGQWWVLVDITLRMLKAPELYKAQGFPADYIIDWGMDHIPGPGGLAIPTGQRVPLTTEQQVKSCGNSVCPPVAAAIVRANYVEAGTVRRAA